MHVERGNDMLRPSSLVDNFDRMANRFNACLINGDAATIEGALYVRNRNINVVHAVIWKCDLASIQRHAANVELTFDESGFHRANDGCFIQSAISQHLGGVTLIDKCIRQAQLQHRNFDTRTCE